MFSFCISNWLSRFISIPIEIWKSSFAEIILVFSLLQAEHNERGVHTVKSIFFSHFFL